MNSAKDQSVSENEEMRAIAQTVLNDPDAHPADVYAAEILMRHLEHEQQLAQ